MKRLHIGIVCDEYPPAKHGGIGSVVSDLAEGVADRGHMVTIIGNYGEETLRQFANLEQYLSNVRVLRLKSPPLRLRHRPREILGRLALRRRVQREHRHNPFDIVEWPDYNGSMPWGVGPGPKSIVRLHGSNLFFDNELGREPQSFEHWLERKSIRAADHIFSVSRFAAQRSLKLCGLEGREWELIYNAVDCDLFSPEPDMPIVPGTILYVNSMSPKKGIEELFQGLNEVFTRVNRARLVVVGGAAYKKIKGQSYQDYLMNMLKPEFRDHVEFTGVLDRRTGVLQQMRQAQVVCIPSHMETFGISPVEAMSVGKAVVFSKTGPGPEIIQDSIDGLLCDPHDPASIAERLITVLRDQDLAHRLGARARETVLARFSLQRWIDRNLELYRQCLEGTKI